MTASPETPHQTANRLARENKAMRRMLAALVKEIEGRGIRLRNDAPFQEARNFLWGSDVFHTRTTMNNPVAPELRGADSAGEQQ
jgi:hypothetical protein